VDETPCEFVSVTVTDCRVLTLPVVIANGCVYVNWPPYASEASDAYQVWNAAPTPGGVKLVVWIWLPGCGVKAKVACVISRVLEYPSIIKLNPDDVC
jgi:hypothetical protein